MVRGSTRGWSGYRRDLVGWATCWVLLIGLVIPAAIPAQEERPSEADIFSDVPEETEVTAPPEIPGEPPPPDWVPPEGKLRERTPPPTLTEARLREFLKDYLQIGGLLYFRTLTEFREHVGFDNAEFSNPLLSDFYLDARASDRLRGFWSGRLEIDPTEKDATTDFIQNELWIRTDIAKRLFIQMGRQHIKWGTGTIWNPTDFLQPDKLDPLDPFDFRIGVDMVKLHYPLEEQGMNFYGFLLFEDADRLEEMGAAFRYEIVLGNGEYGLDFVVPSDGGRPQGGFDYSAAVGPFDIYGEVALANGENFKVEKMVAPDTFEKVREEGLKLQTNAGIQWATLLREEDKFDIGFEYFYNELGYSDTDVYDDLQQDQLFQSLYVGKHYASIYMGLEGPWNFNDVSFMLFNIANLSDTSFITQLNMAYAIWVNLTFEIQTAVHYGHEDGESRQSMDSTDPEAKPIFDLGIRFKLKI